jgi:hydroxymethylbilane synthase
MTFSRPLKIGTRGSALALWQADFVADALREAHPGLETEKVLFKTAGDRFLDRPLAEIGGKGLFTKELEVSLASGEIDLAVHSLKDMPTRLPDGLVLAAIPQRADVRDCVITPLQAPEATLAPPAVVGTASLRRACLARDRWPAARIEPIRGNVTTRLERVLAEGERRCDAVVLAMAGLQRLALMLRDDVSFLPLNPEHWIPAVGQGALALETRADDAHTNGLVAALHHEDTARCVAAERAFLRAVEGDCRVPVGAFAMSDRGVLRLRGFIGDPSTGERVVEALRGDAPEALGVALAEALLAAGGREILQRVRASGALGG